MTPGQASEKGDVLVIDHPDGGRRIAAHVFDVDGGIAFLDIGWTDLVITNNPAHIIEAEFSEFSLGWGATIDTGDVFVEVDSQGRKPEGSRSDARRALEASLSIKIPK